MTASSYFFSGSVVAAAAPGALPETDERSTLMRTFSWTSSVTVLSVRPEMRPMTPPEVTTSSPFLSDLSHVSVSFCFFCWGRIKHEVEDRDHQDHHQREAALPAAAERAERAGRRCRAGGLRRTGARRRRPRRGRRGRRRSRRRGRGRRRGGRGLQKERGDHCCTASLMGWACTARGPFRQLNLLNLGREKALAQVRRDGRRRSQVGALATLLAASLATGCRTGDEACSTACAPACPAGNPLLLGAAEQHIGDVGKACAYSGARVRPTARPASAADPAGQPGLRMRSGAAPFCPVVTEWAVAPVGYVGRCVDADNVTRELDSSLNGSSGLEMQTCANGCQTIEVNGSTARLGAAGPPSAPAPRRRRRRTALRGWPGGRA